MLSIPPLCFMAFCHVLYTHPFSFTDDSVLLQGTFSEQYSSRRVDAALLAKVSSTMGACGDAAMLYLAIEF